MKNLKKISLTLIMTPLLFVGCMSEKTALIKPVIAEKKIAKVKKPPIENIPIQELSVESNQSILSDNKLLASAVFGGTIFIESIDNNQNDISLLSQQTLTNQNDISLLSQQTLTNQITDLHETWNAITKEDEILETARKFLGVKYIWAANGPFAFDCSGFTKYVFKNSGITLPRYSGHQANIGKKIKFSQMEKGDLVFFDTGKKFKKRVNHVGIFIGDNKFIHASSAKKKVIITSFSKKKFYKNKFLYARRVLKNNESFALNISPVKKHSLIVN